MAPLQPLHNLKFHRFFFQIESINVASSINNQPPPFFIESFSNANLWICMEKIKRKRKDYEQNRVFQDVWNVKLSWVELVVDEQRKVHQARFVPK